jgi:RNA polymerase sigma-70 factor (ECF subfamily)
MSGGDWNSMSSEADQQQFFAELDAHRRILSKVARSYCRQPADQEDLVQEIVVQLWRSYPRFDGRSKFSTWMYKVALNVAISYHRSEVARTRYVISDEDQLLSAAEPAEQESPELGILYEFIDALNPLDRALVLLYLDGHSHAEISQVLGISAANVATKISRTKQSMQQQLSKSPNLT